MKIVQYEESATWTQYNVEMVQHKRSVTWKDYFTKKCNMEMI